MLTVAIVGRPNVGKSTLFNRLAGKRLAIVHDTPGVTRDRRDAEVSGPWGKFRFVDTAGFEAGKPESLAQRMTEQTRAAIADSDVCLFLLDAREGVTAGDQIIANVLRRSGKPVILAANKSEGHTAIEDADIYALGFDAAHAISAEHNQGIDDLFAALGALGNEEDVPDGADADPARPLHLAIVGRPNTGKSSLFNALLGQERALTGPEPGLTRDAIAAQATLAGRDVLFHDTAGLRKRARAAGEKLEQLSIASTLRAIRFADCVIILIDATQAFEKQDLVIADLVESEGRAMVFALSKWDLVENRAGAITRFRETRDRLLPQAAGAPLVAVSTVTGEGLDRLAQAVFEADRAWNKRIPTFALNRELETLTTRHAPPAFRGRRPHLRYMTQAKARPPTFVLFGSNVKSLSPAYLRYLQNALRDRFALAGAPIRFLLRASRNPYGA